MKLRIACVSRSLAHPFVLGLLAVSGATASATGGEGEVDFEDLNINQNLTNYVDVVDSWRDVPTFNPMPFSGLAWDSQGRIWACNTYGNTVVCYVPGEALPDRTLHTGVNPVSVAVWEPENETPLVLVTCSGTHALFVYEMDSGKLVESRMMASEPADMVIDDTNGKAWISCQGNNVVQCIDIQTLAVEGSYEITCGERPGHLYFDPADGSVYVAAAVTGNNSIPVGANFGGAGFALDLGTQPQGSPQLPDHDIFRIDPAAGTISAVAKGAGSLLFGIGRAPTNDEFWVLSTRSLNAFSADEVNIGPGEEPPDTEPAINGQFAINQLVIYDSLSSGSSGIQVPSDRIDLDDTDPTEEVEYSPRTSINQARAVAFRADGEAFVVSPMSHVMIRLDASGNRLADDVALGTPGARVQAYDVAANPLNDTQVAVLCLGTMAVDVYDTSQSDPTGVTHDLGFDPTPAQIRRGRDIFLDGQISANGRFTCGSCHPRGMSDQLGWSLRGHPADVKDLMLTQSLLSIADTFPHHWRGERDLVDFHGAFAGLLGARASKVPVNDESDDADETDDFIAFLQSLQAPANPAQHRQRVLDERRGSDDFSQFPETDEYPDPIPWSLELEPGSPRQGQMLFMCEDNFTGRTCAECHQPESGSSGAFVSEAVKSRAPRAISIEVAHLRQLQHRGTGTLDFDPLPPAGGVPQGGGNPVFTTNKKLVNQNGFGVTHNGTHASLLEFILDTGAFAGLNDEQQQAIDVFRFVEQFDQGIAPAVHWSMWLDEESSSVAGRINATLLEGARNHWNGVGVFGRYFDHALPGWVDARWWFNPGTELFEWEAQADPGLNWVTMRNMAIDGDLEAVFVGVPPGYGRQFGIDWDGDGITNADEAAGGTNPWIPNWSDDQADPVIVECELAFASSRMARYNVRFSEPVTYSVSYSNDQESPPDFVRTEHVTSDTFVLTHDSPSSFFYNGEFVDPLGQPLPLITHPFTATISFKDRDGNPGSALLDTGSDGNTSFTPGELIPFTPVAGTFAFAMHVAQLEWEGATSWNPGSGLFRGEVVIGIDWNDLDRPWWTVPDPAAHPPGETPELEDVIYQIVFSSVAIKRVNDTEFSKPSGQELHTSLEEDFEILWNVDPSNPDYGLTNNYQVAPGEPWVVSPRLALPDPDLPVGTEVHDPLVTRVEFRLLNLEQGDQVKFSVMGIVGEQVKDGQAFVPTLEAHTLFELTPLKLEKSMELTWTMGENSL